MSIHIAMVAAMGNNRVIGAAGAIPWRLPTDFAHFRRTTLGKPVIMGRKTFESIGSPLKGRTTIVITRQRDYRQEAVIVVHSLADALEQGRAIARRDGLDEVIVAGGAEIYTEAMPLADRLYITHVELAPEGDAYFPPIDPARWADAAILPVVPGEKDSAGFSVHRYERRGGSAR